MEDLIKIIIIDDNPDDRALLARELKRAFSGINLVYVIDEQGLDESLASDQYINLVITDYKLHWTDGVSVLKKVKAQYPLCPVVMFTGTGSEQIAVEAMKAGLDDYVIKSPKQFGRLAATIRHVLEKARMLRRAVRLESQLQSLLDRLHVGVFMAALDGRLLEANPAFNAILGRYFFDPIQDLNLADLFSKPDEFAELQNKLKSVGSVREHETSFKRADNSVFWVSLTETLTKTSDNETIIEGIIEDIDERKKAEIRSQLFSRLSQLLSLATAPQHAAEIIVEVAQSLWGWDACFIQLYSPAQDLLFPIFAVDTIDGKQHHIPAEKLNQKPSRLAHKIMRDGGQLILRDNPQFHDDLHPFGDTNRPSASMMFVPIHDGQRAIGILSVQSYQPNMYNQEALATLKTIADHCGSALERIHAREELRESEERYRNFFEDDLTGDFIATVDGHLIACNSAFANMFGFKSVQEAMQYNIRELFLSPEDYDQFVNRLNEQKKLVYFEAELRRPDKKRVFVIQNVIGKFDPKGQLFEIKGYLFDNTERKNLEHQFLQSQKMEAIGRLAGGLAHDFNNLLTVIGGYSDLALAELTEGDPLRKDLEEIRKATERAASLTRQLLAFSRKQVLQPKLIDLNTIIGNIQNMLPRLIGEDIELVTKLAPELGMIKADPSQIEQVILNLAVNSRDAMPNGGRLTIETTDIDLAGTEPNVHFEIKAAPYVMLAVSDNGVGMDSETQSHLFEPFFTTKEQGKGTGLGLSTVYGIVKQSDGYIWVYSVPNRGTTFKIYFPRVVGEIDTLPLIAMTPEDLRGTETVLLVEDEEIVRDLASRVLVKYGYHVLEASNGGEGLLICERNQKAIDLLITDVVLPHMSGRELAERLAPIRPDMKVLYMSGYTDDAIVHLGVLDKGMPFLQKPFAPNALVQKVREVLDNHSSTREDRPATAQKEASAPE